LVPREEPADGTVASSDRIVRGPGALCGDTRASIEWVSAGTLGSQAMVHPPLQSRSRDLVGTSPRRPDGLDKVTGRALFVDDISVPGCLHGATIRSPYARARIVSIDGSAALADPEVVFVTAADIPGPNMLAMIENDWPILADKLVEHCEEPVALVAAPTRQRALAAAAAVRVVYELLPAVLDLEQAHELYEASPDGDSGAPDDESPAPDDGALRSRVLARCDVQHGDAEAALAAAPHIIEGVYRTGAQEHIYIEPQGVIATPTDEGGIDIVGSLQCPYYVHGALSQVFGEGKVRVRQSVTGGGFGGKEDYPDIIAAHAALLALASGRPVKLIYDRCEDLRATTKRHPARVRLRAGVDNDGKLLALECEFHIDAGAYVTLSPVVLSRGVLHAAGPYAIPNVTIRGRALATNSMPYGAFRGFGAPQSQFAMERLMDAIGRQLGIDPFELRKRNAYRAGDITPTGQVLDESTSAMRCLEEAEQRTGFRERWRQNEADRAAAHATGRAARGIGLALFWHGSGFTGNGERQMRSPVHLALVPGGRLQVRVSSTDFGQGTCIVLGQIAADATGLPLDQIDVVMPDTGICPDSGPTVASRTVMVVGGTLWRAGQTLTRRLLAYVAEREGLAPEAVALVDGCFVVAADGSDDDPRELAGWTEIGEAYVAQHGELLIEERYEPDPKSSFDEQTYRGDAYATYGWGAAVVDVDVDPDTFITTLHEATMVVDVGRVIHPVLCRGQVEGGLLQSLGQGLLEDLTYRDGHPQQDRLATYIIPTTLDTPAMDIVLLENPAEGDAFGAKGVGELPADGGAPALVAAIENAAGIVARSIPATPERLLDALIAGDVVGSGPDVDTTFLKDAADTVSPVREASAAQATVGESSDGSETGYLPTAPGAPEGVSLDLLVNGREVGVVAPPMARLLDVLREDLGLTGTKEGCGEGECGSCTVLLDGEPVCSCLVPVVQAQGRSVLTVEGLECDGEPDAFQQAMVSEGGVQCGACTPGILVAARALLERNEQPDREAVREALAGNLCRCTGYEAILRAMAAATRRDGGADS
jgi:CO/xanthine dehydrogenase Mo-binding subunit/aerobic-type carbon monoxide dehydrogenase small subunit (CoxS/CutS family)